MQKEKENLIIQTVSDIVGVSVKDVCSKNRTMEVADARFIIFYLLREAHYSFNRIARMFDRNHTSVIHGVKKVKQVERLNNMMLYIDHEIYKKLIDENEIS